MGLEPEFRAIHTRSLKVLAVGREGGLGLGLSGPRWETDSGKQSTSVISGLEEASPEPAGAQVSMEESQEELTSGLDVGECEKRAREMLGVGRDANVAA